MTRCTRCLIPIMPEEFSDYLAADHVCVECSAVTASEHYAIVKASEKGPRVRGESIGR